MVADSEKEQYENLQERQNREWEAACKHCGACCGQVEGDPCEHLSWNDKGLSFCRIYEQRFGLRKTITGHAFYCVPIRQILHRSWPGDVQCIYKKRWSC